MLVDRLKTAKRRVEDVSKKPVVRIILIIGLILLLLFGQYMKQVLLVTLLGVLSAISFLHYRFLRTPIAFELCLFATVITSITYGTVLGALVGSISMLVGFIMSSQFQHKSFFSFGAIMLIAVFSNIFKEINIVLLGVSMTIIYDIMILPLYLLLGSTYYKSAIYFVTHIIINYWIFSNLAPILLTFIG